MHNGANPHSCKECSHRFTTSSVRERRVRYKHTPEKPHKCTKCGYRSLELSTLRRHERCHTGESPYQCPHCTYVSPDTLELQHHLRKHTGEKPYKCERCNMRFTQSNSLKSHMLIHNIGEQPVYKCKLCPAQCGRKTDLRIHIQKLHTSEKPLKCKRCGKSFPDRYSCKTHEGENCFKCEVYPYASTTLRHLQSHMLKHTDPLHDPESGHRDRALALQLCQQKRVNGNPQLITNSPKASGSNAAGNEKELKRDEVTVSDGDDQQYLILEVIQLEDDTEQQLAFAAPEYFDENEEEEENDNDGAEEKEEEDDDDSMEIDGKPQSSKKNFEHERSSKVEDDVDTCFGSDLITNSPKASGSNAAGNEKELKRDEVTVSDGDDQQYLILEVIQLEDDTEQQLAFAAPEYFDENEEEEENDNDGAEEKEEEDDDDSMEIDGKPQSSKKNFEHERSSKVEDDVDTCFGSDEHENDEAEINFEDEELVTQLI